MEAPVTLPVEAIRAGLAADPEWALAARYWNVDIRFFVGADNYVLRVEDGRVAAFERRPDASFAWTILIGGPVEAWRELLKEVPRPYYQDFLPAQVFHGFACGGDLEALYAYYAAISRILAIMRRCAAPARS